mgnify:CR=1 FL=1
MMNEKLKPFLAGFDLVGRRLPNGRLQSYSFPKPEIDEWPEEVEMLGNTYTLDDVTKLDDGYESASYV